MTQASSITSETLGVDRKAHGTATGALVCARSATAGQLVIESESKDSEQVHMD